MDGGSSLFNPLKISFIVFLVFWRNIYNKKRRISGMIFHIVDEKDGIYHLDRVSF